MNDGLLLIIAIGVFSLMVIGLGLTIYEFREHIIEDPLKKNQTFHGEKVEHRFKGVDQESPEPKHTSRPAHRNT